MNGLIGTEFQNNKILYYIWNFIVLCELPHYYMNNNMYCHVPEYKSYYLCMLQTRL